MQEATANTDIRVSEFTVAPQINPSEGLPYHEWFVEFENNPEDLPALAKKIDQSLQTQNSYYFDLIKGKVLQPLKITKVEKDGFQNYMKSIGKLGGQNKIPRLSNDRKIVDLLR
ncbi:putative auxin-regulated protein [Algibacter lectus]|uniref:Putative auxin-regulated protein n=1 Tax=Algibacter lectus TaxID=221126 RepID=A0A090WR04_9FLAO|nr:putative auxin-regulated protein [Algibacter lectus]